VDFLKEEQHGIDHRVDMNLARVASGGGHWALYEELAEEDNPLEDIDVATEIAQDAVRFGNLALACRVIEENKLDPKTLALDVINGGDPKTYRYAIKEGWFTLKDTFERGATVQHLLARQGHFDLLIDLLNNDQERNAVYALDDYEQSLLHYAAVGGHWNIYCYLQRQPLDLHESTIAHCAAAGGSVWFLKQLFKSENGPELINLRDKHGATILHHAANCGEPSILFMIIEEFGIDVTAKDNWGRTVLHRLAELAENDFTIWDAVVDLVQRYPEKKLADIPDINGKSVRQLFAEWKSKVNFQEDLFTPDNSADEIDDEELLNDEGTAINSSYQ
jgi:hypothetical protein